MLKKLIVLSTLLFFCFANTCLGVSVNLAWMSLLLGSGNKILTETKLISTASGGKITLSDGTELDIPGGALSKDTEITVSKVTSDKNILLVFEPDELTFSKPAGLSISVPPSLDKPDLELLIYSHENPAIDIDNELVVLQPLSYIRNGNTLSAELSHFSVVRARTGEVLNAVFAIPQQFLQKGDLQYNLSNPASNVTGWVPGHVVMYVGNNQQANHVESNYKYNGVVYRENADPSLDNANYMHMGSKRRKNIIPGELDTVVDFAINQIGEPYISIGWLTLGYLPNIIYDALSGYTCTGLVETAYEEVNKSLVHDVSNNLVFPDDQFESKNLETVKSIAVEEGETISFRVYGVGKKSSSNPDTIFYTHTQIAAEFLNDIPETSYVPSSKIFTFHTTDMGRLAPYKFNFKMTHTFLGEEYSVTDTLTVYVEEPVGTDNFTENFSDGNYTSNPTWTAQHASIRPGTVTIVDGGARFYRSGAGGSGSGEFLKLDTNIGINSNSSITFDAKPVGRSVRSGCGDSCTEHPVNIQLYLEDDIGAEYIARYSVNYNGAVQNVTSGNFKQVAYSAQQNTWKRDLSYKISDLWPTATKITSIWIFGAGWDFDGYIDNISITK